MATRDIVPLWVETEEGRREATLEEVENFKQRDPKQYNKWNKDNRITLGKTLIKAGIPTSEAWGKAFNQYPDNTQEKKPKYVFKMN